MKKLILLLAMLLALTGCSAILFGVTQTHEEVRTENISRPQVPPVPRQPAPQPVPSTLTLTVSPGYTLARIGATLEEMGVVTAAQFIHAAQTADFSDFALVAAMPQSPERFFVLEGYLFPGVYEIYPDESPEDIIRRMLANTESSIDDDLRSAIEQSGRTVDEVLIMASIIQSESLGNDDSKPLVSSVIHNRIGTGMMLQMCKTSFYVRDYIAPLYDGDVQRFHAYYNTYMFHGLPVGPIGNPGLSAIRAALSPAQTDYFFYIWDEDDNFHFAATWEEHQANVRQYLQ